MMSMVSVVSQGRCTALLMGIFSAAVVSMVSRVIDHASSGFRKITKDVDLSAKLCFSRVLKRSLSAHLIRVK